MKPEQESVRRRTVQKEGFFPSEGRWLFYRCWHTQPKKGEIIAIHGACEHSERYQELGNTLCQKGYDFYVFDLTGHGRSEGRRGHINYFEEYLVDIANFYGFLRIYRSMETPFLIGHSMGGLLASLFAAWGPCSVKGIILSAPLFRWASPFSFWQRQMTKLLSVFYPTCNLATNVEPSMLTHDRDIAEDYAADPLVQSFMTSRWLREIWKAMKLAPHAAEHLNMPCMVLHGEGDKLVDVEGSKAFFHKLSAKDKIFYLVPHGCHELFNELDRTKIYTVATAWLDSRS